MSSRGRYAARITERSTAAAMKHRGGGTAEWSHLSPHARCGLQPIHFRERKPPLRTTRPQPTRTWRCQIATIGSTVHKPQCEFTALRQIDVRGGRPRSMIKKGRPSLDTIDQGTEPALSLQHHRELQSYHDEAPGGTSSAYIRPLRRGCCGFKRIRSA